MNDAQSTVDGRREAGERTRQRLVEATRDLIADRGESAVSLRAITDAAGTNVAAVSYHFGSKDSLVREAIEQSVGRLVQEQVDGLRSLEEPTPEQIAAAWCGPVVRAVAASPCPDQVFMRVVGRTLSSCTEERRSQVAGPALQADIELMSALAAARPDLDDAELAFRASAAGSVLNFVTSGAAGLEGKPAADIERLLVPAVAGVLGGSPAAR
jgi:AcrR family transcriptional regulator